MLRASWRADRLRSAGALVTTGLIPVTRPLRAIGLGVFVDGVISGDHRRMVTGVAIVAGLTGVNRMLDWASLTIRMRLREHTILFLDQKVMELAAGAPGLEHHERPDLQDHMELLRIDRGYLVNPFMPIAWTLASVIQIAVTVLVLARLHPVLALLPVAGVPSLLATIRVEGMREKVRRQEAERTRLLLHLLELTTEAPAGKEVRVFGLADELVRRHREVFDDVERAQVRFNVRSALIMATGWTTFALGYMAAIAFVALRAVDGALSVGAVVITFSMGAQINGQLSELVANITWFSRTANAIGRFRWLQKYADEAEAAVTPRDPRPAPERLRDGITLDDVGFAYPGTDVPVLDHVSLRLPAGSTVAIVGENGAGKTTLVKLLCRFYEPTHGTIEVDGTDLRCFAIDEWRARLAGGFQDFARLQFVALESVGVGDLRHFESEPAVVGALTRAAADDVLPSLPDGLATQLGRDFDGGVELSVGQWQKVALGRAMMREAPLVLVLDEPTASLDAPTEHSLFERFAGAAREAAAHNGAITVLVSHRFSTVRVADLIVVVAGGRVAEAGSHDQLMDADGMYAELYRLQARGYG